MKLIRNSALVAAVSLVALSANPAFAEKKDKNAPAAAPAAPAATSNVVQGIAVANLQAAIANTDAFRVAQQQRPVTYKPQLDQAQARSNAAIRSVSIIEDSSITRNRNGSGFRSLCRNEYPPDSAPAATPSIR